MLGILLLSVTDTGITRLMLLVLLLVAVGLLLVGSTIALMTLRNQRKFSVATISSKPLESEKG